MFNTDKTNHSWITNQRQTSSQYYNISSLLRTALKQTDSSLAWHGFHCNFEKSTRLVIELSVSTSYYIYYLSWFFKSPLNEVHPLSFRISIVSTHHPDGSFFVSLSHHLFVVLVSSSYSILLLTAYDEFTRKIIVG